MSTRRNAAGDGNRLSRRRFLGAGLGGAALLGAGPVILSACGGDDDDKKSDGKSNTSTGGNGSTEPPETVKVGVISTYTGVAAFIGDITKRSLDAATKHLDKIGGSGGRRVELIERDVSGPEGLPVPQLAVQHVQEFIDDPDCIGILWSGPLNGLPETLADIDDSGMPLISVFGDLGSYGALYPGNLENEDIPPEYEGLELRSVFQMYLPDQMAIELLVDYCKDRGYKSAGMIYDSLSFGGAGGWFEDAMKDRGLEVAGVESFTLFDSEYGQQVDNLRSAGGDALFIYGLSSNTAGVVKQVDAVGGRYVDAETAMGDDWKPQIMGSPGGTGERSWVELAGDAARPGTLTVWFLGGLVGQPDFPIRDMLKAAGHDVPTGGEESPADGLAALLRAAEEAGSTDPDAMVEALESGIEIQFASPLPFKFSEERHLSKEKSDLILITLERAPMDMGYDLGKEFGTTFPADYEGPVAFLDYTVEANKEAHPELMEEVIAGYGTYCDAQRQGDEAKVEACKAVH